MSSTFDGGPIVNSPGRKAKTRIVNFGLGYLSYNKKVHTSDCLRLGMPSWMSKVRNSICLFLLRRLATMYCTFYFYSIRPASIRGAVVGSGSRSVTSASYVVQHLLSAPLAKTSVASRCVASQKSWLFPVGRSAAAVGTPGATSLAGWQPALPNRRTRASHAR